MEKLSQFIINHWFLITAFIIALIALCILETCSKWLSESNHLTPYQVVRLINSEEAVVIDIRDYEAFKRGHITYAINIPATALDKSLKEVEKYKQQSLIIVCTMGKQSAHFVNKLCKRGYQRVYMLAGGMGAWINANMPVVK